MPKQEENAAEFACRPSHAGRRVLVTGAGRGIGRAIALGFAARGATVGVADMNADDIAGTVALIATAGHGKGVPLMLDVADYSSVEKALVEAAILMGGAFDTVVNNAGISPKHDGVAHKVWEMDPAEWGRVVAVNLTGAFNTIRALTPSMREAGRGWIVNLSSVAGKTYSPVVACNYAATKSALIGFTKGLARDLGPRGITVNIVHPGSTDTDMNPAGGPGADAQRARMAIPRYGQPEDIAGLVAYLASEEARFITGAGFAIDGGVNT